MEKDKDVIMELKLVLTEDDIDFKEFKLCNERNEHIVSFDVEINKETALISYETKESFRHQGYASKGLNLLNDTLFSNDSILFLELINLSGDYSRKVAENAGFFSPNNTPDYYVFLNPRAEEIINEKLNTLDASSQIYKKAQRQMDKVSNLRRRENFAKEKMHAKLEQLLYEKELTESEEYRKVLESEINHLQKILIDQQDTKSL